MLLEWSGGDLPATWTFRSSPGCRGLLYLWPHALPCKTTAHQTKGAHQELRLMGNGSQTVLPPSRHASGALYTWEPGLSPQDLAPAPAPAWLVERLRKEPRPDTCAACAKRHETPDAARVQRALDAIPNEDAPYEDWLTIGMALHSTEAPWARDLWDAWSQQSGKYDKDKQEKAWNSFQAEGGVTLGSLFQMAQAQGRTSPQSRMPSSGRTARHRQRPSRTRPYPTATIPTPSPLCGIMARTCGIAIPGRAGWCGMDRCWEQDTSGAVMRLAKQTVKRLARRVEELPDAAANALMAHIKTSLSTAKLKALIENAQSEPGIPVQPEELDTHPSLLNCRNGTLDLTTGTLRPPDRADLLTKCLHLDYNRSASCQTWWHFLWQIFGGGPLQSWGDILTPQPDDPDTSAGALENRRLADERAQRLLTFLQRATGYSLTGDTREQCLFLAHGTGSNGKTTALEALQRVLAAYAQSTPSATLLVKDRPDGIPNDVARLRGARLVTAVEIGEGKRLNEELIKRLTGQDRLTARFLHGEFFDFTPEFKLFIACNHLPKIYGTDHAIWRRIKRIPFTVTIPDAQQDKDLPAKLTAEAEGILAWMVEGCLAWQREGLGTPEEVILATKDYRTAMDVVGRFIEECCLVSANVRVKTSEIYAAYKKWCDTSGEYAITLTAFGTRLEEQGFQKHVSGGVWRLGLGLVSTPPL